MTQPIDFVSAHLTKQGRTFHKDDSGDIWFPYCFEYEHESRGFSLTLWARNIEEAESLKESVKASLKLSRDAPAPVSDKGEKECVKHAKEPGEL